MVVSGVTGTITQAEDPAAGPLRQAWTPPAPGANHPLNAAQRRDLGGVLTSMAFKGGAAGHPWPSPATWSLNLGDRQPLRYVQVEPTVVAEIELDAATGSAGRPRHLAHHCVPGASCCPSTSRSGPTNR
jgi:hypothetical protein